MGIGVRCPDAIIEASLPPNREPPRPSRPLRGRLRMRLSESPARGGVQQEPEARWSPPTSLTARAASPTHLIQRRATHGARPRRTCCGLASCMPCAWQRCVTNLCWNRNWYPAFRSFHSSSGAPAISDHSAFWTKAISINLDTGERLVLRSPQDALYALVSDWPMNGGVHQQRAMDFCRAWLAGRMPAETVRQAFVLAALEAGVAISDDDQTGAESPVSNSPV
ncbi:Protein of unknown function (DUF982) [Rhizobium leguminosarum bv. trifolii WSM2012]|nr:Protein of unknown function (DUF982) [Rhizobium leguminosarum bv. trifolii WSM2012]